MRPGLAIAGVLAAGCALLACDSLFGIQTFADPSEAGTGADATTEVGGDSAEVGSDSVAEAEPTSDSGADAAADTATGLDASTDSAAQDSPADQTGMTDAAADADSSISGCTPQCNLTETKCDASGELETCVKVNNCPRWVAAPCAGGQSCWGVPFAAYCCAGGPSVCAPSCHDAGPGDPDAGNGQTNCGRAGNESCCASLDVTGGTFLRSYDGVNYTDGTNPATISNFALDKFEVSVGRFRQFVAAASAGWVPNDGDGVHAHLNAGRGLVDSSDADGGAFEHGWYSAWDSELPATTDWTSYLESDPVHSTWTNNPSQYEAYAINSLNWYVAYAFCIWDGGFLPSETEWNYAASGGSQQRVYPWSVPPTTATIDCTEADYGACADAPTLMGIYTNGYGRYGQADLAGGEWEWTLDYSQTYVPACFDCAYLSDPGTDQRTLRGGAWNYAASYLYASTRLGDDPTIHFSNDGLRCARAP